MLLHSWVFDKWQSVCESWVWSSLTYYSLLYITVHTLLFTNIVKGSDIYLETPAAWWFVCLCTVTCCESTPCCGLCYSYGIVLVQKYDHDLSPLSLKHGKHNTGRMLWIRKQTASFKSYFLINRILPLNLCKSSRWVLYLSYSSYTAKSKINKFQIFVFTTKHLQLFQKVSLAS